MISPELNSYLLYLPMFGRPGTRSEPAHLLSILQNSRVVGLHRGFRAELMDRTDD